MIALFRTRSNRKVIDRLHAEIMAAARNPHFYERCCVPDTFEGRFELLTLHASLALRRLNALPKPGPEVAKDLVEALFAGLDAALRERGVGDLSVPKRMKGLARAFFGRATAYDAALRDGEAALAQSIARNVLGAAADENGAGAAALARHAMGIDTRLATLTLQDVLEGGLRFSHQDL